MVKTLDRGSRDRTVIALRALMEQLQALPVTQSCLDCALYGGDGFCQRWKTYVPEANIDNNDCGAWVDDQIPF